MLETHPSAPELFRLEAIREILRSPGPCITILLPPHHPGEPTGAPAAVLRSNIQEAARDLAEKRFSAISHLLEPLQVLAKDPSLHVGSHWSRAIFRSPTIFEQFFLIQPIEARLNVGGSFAIRWLASELARPATFYILALSQKGVKLLRCARLDCDLVKLPPGVPETLEEALALEPPDHDLENRSSAGASSGAMHSVRFGTGSGRERERVHLMDYYTLVDRGLEELTHEAETFLIPAGVEEDVAIFRSISRCRRLAKRSIVGAPDVARGQANLLREAYSILFAEGLEKQREALSKAKEQTAPARFSTDLDSLLRAASEGRVGQIYVNERVERIGLFDRANYRSWGEEDLLNLAMVQTLVHHGKACVLPAKMMPGRCIAAGILRF